MVFAFRKKVFSRFYGKVYASKNTKCPVCNKKMGAYEEKESVELGNAKSPISNRSPELLEQPQQHVGKPQHQPLSETPQILIKTNGEDEGAVVGGGASAESEWVISIKQKLNVARQDDDTLSWSDLSIYKVPHHQGDDKAYVPQIVSLGPYHHVKERLRQMDRHKWHSLQLVLKRNNQDIELYLDSIKELEGKDRDCYEGPINMSSREFVEMMVLDGCFVLEILRVANEGLEQLGSSRSEETEQPGYSTNDPIFAMPGSMHLILIQRDMIMLENQIPLFILDRLLGLQLGCPDQRGRVAELAIKFFGPLMPTEEPLTKDDENNLESSLGSNSLFDQGELHLLDVFRRSLLHTFPGHCATDKHPLQQIHCITELRDAGVKFKKRETHTFWDIKFTKGVLEIPKLLIDDGTKSLFLNLIAFEQCHLDCTNTISSYVLFMDHLINASEDVHHLHHRGIIEHWLGSDDKVADPFNLLCQDVVFDINDSYFSKLSEEINKYYNEYYGHRRNAWKVVLMHKYFSNPWSIISVIAGVVLLLLTFTQTFYGVYGYYRPS